ncbi:M15 family metallopeptidase [Croceicoccus sp. YJ47]|uniref:M15 family metallopeptidase n=1 Tax=Croceicoccus sp. YJ47 TaxID=2798724 RepID=UPI0019230D93|nr:M15 family metallopeptidase [Croceicoccus sp. YJ47]QQN75384.1 hypothetical protein JD971_07055 [Croceicoccus sp. YJ47]
MEARGMAMMDRFEMSDGLVLVPCARILNPRVFAIVPAYADPACPVNGFGALYRRDVTMLGEAGFLAAFDVAGRIYHEATGHRIRVLDCFRPVEAQQAMAALRPDVPGHLLAVPGTGAHPRGMAIDIQPFGDAGDLDLGTPFDDFTESGQRQSDRAHDFADVDPDRRAVIAENRRALDAAVRAAAGETGVPLVGLPSEWWDYRLPAADYERYAPVSDAQLPPEWRYLSRDQAAASG